MKKLQIIFKNIILQEINKIFKTIDKIAKNISFIIVVPYGGVESLVGKIFNENNYLTMDKY